VAAVLLTGWEWHPVLVAALAVTGVGYVAIWRRGTAPSRAALLAWQGGLFAIAVATCSGVDPLSDARLSAHMVQHELLTFLAAPLLVAGMRPVTLALLPRLGFPLARWGHALTRPRTAWMVAAAVLWGWHWPPAYDYALAHPAVHDVEHVTLLMAYTLYWSPFTPFGHAVAALRTDAARTLYLATGGAQSGLLGAVLAFAGTPVYRHYAAAPTGGEVALADQQLGGMIMLLSGAVVFALAGAVTMRDE